MKDLKNMKDKFVIIDLRNMDFMKDDDKKLIIYDTYEEASLTCGMYEFEDAWICKLIHNYVEEEVLEAHRKRFRGGNDE
jgi:hypothetical protein